MIVPTYYYYVQTFPSDSPAILHPRLGDNAVSETIPIVVFFILILQYSRLETVGKTIARLILVFTRGEFYKRDLHCII